MEDKQGKLIDEIVHHRALETVYPSREALAAALKTGRGFRIYLGADATGPHIHLGHLTNFLVMKKLQELGCEVIFLIGDFTARIGDPTDKLAARQPLTEQEVKENYRSFKKQVGKILDLKGKNPLRITFNAKWLAKMNLKNLIELAGHFTVQQMIERDMFQERIKAGKPIGLHEFLYPLMQGYDSVAMNVDAEIGGTDQTFNMLAGRTLCRSYLNKEKFVLTTRLLTNPRTGKKIMNKSEGGLINLDDAPDEMFGKVMAIADDSVFALAELCTEMSDEHIKNLRAAIEKGENPRNVKLEIAQTITAMVHNNKVAVVARENFEKTFSRHEIPENVPGLQIKEGVLSALDLAASTGILKSKSDARRLIEQGGLEYDGAPVKDVKTMLVIKNNAVLRVGKKHFFRIKN